MLTTLQREGFCDTELLTSHHGNGRKLALHISVRPIISLDEEGDLQLVFFLATGQEISCVNSTQPMSALHHQMQPSSSLAALYNNNNNTQATAASFGVMEPMSMTISNLPSSLTPVSRLTTDTEFSDSSSSFSGSEHGGETSVGSGNSSAFLTQNVPVNMSHSSAPCNSLASSAPQRSVGQTMMPGQVPSRTQHFEQMNAQNYLDNNPFGLEFYESSSDEADDFDADDFETQSCFEKGLGNIFSAMISGNNSHINANTTTTIQSNAPNRTGTKRSAEELPLDNSSANNSYGSDNNKITRRL